MGERFNSYVATRLPDALAASLHAAAQRRHQKPSEYLRQALVAALAKETAA